MLSHFMLFSGVTWPKLASMMAAFLPVVSLPWSVQVPKYSLPLALNSLSMLWAAWRGSRESTAGAAETASGANRSTILAFILMARDCDVGMGKVESLVLDQASTEYLERGGAYLYRP